MKVKRKLPNEDIVWIVVEESPSYYLARHQHQTASSGLSMLSKSGYEPIPEETWRNITAECEFDEVLGVLHDESHKLHRQMPEGYRLRKVDGNMYCLGGFKQAFIIERKEPA